VFLKKSWFVLACAATLVCCSSGSKDTPSDYKEKVAVEISLGPSSSLNDVSRDDIFFKVRNNGDRTITELAAEVMFSYSNGEEAMRRRWYLVTVDPSMEKAVLQKKAAQFRPLPPGGAIEFGELMMGFFVGKPEMREKARQDWDKLNAEIKVIMVDTDSG
jgi:hypothetical protein